MKNKLFICLLLALTACTKTPENSAKPSSETNVTQNWYVGVGQFNGNIDFGVLVSNENKINTITVKNSGDTSLIGPPSLTGSDFNLAYHNCESLLPGKSCTVKVTFNSSGKTNGPYSSILKLGESEANITAGVNIPQSGDNLQVSVNSIPVSNNIDFGIIKYNQNILKTITIKNNNLTNEVLSNLSLSSNNFIINYDSCSGKSIKAKQSCQIKLSISGVGKNGSIQENLTFSSLSLTVSAEVKNLESLSATSSDVKLVLNNQAFNPGAIDMGTWNQSKTQTISLYLKNFGTEPGLLGPVNIAAPLQLVYSACSGESLAPNASCLMKVTVVPQLAGTFNGGLSAKGNNYNLQATVRNPGDKISCSIDNAQESFITWNGTSYSQCVVESCLPSHHLVGNVCESNSAVCNIDNGVGIKTWANGSWGSCLVSSCNPSFHESDNSCVSNTKSCAIDNSIATESWMGSSWGSCTVQSCVGNYHQVGNSCVLNTQSCTIENGTGSQNWTGSDWGVCTAQSCDSNYHQIGNTCIFNTQSCIIDNAVASQNWNGTTWGTCTVQSCMANYHQIGNACIFNTQSCQITNGTGSQIWNGLDWGNCSLTSCDPNYHPLNNDCVPNTVSVLISQPLSGQGMITGPTSVNYGTSATFTYAPPSGFQLNSWGGNCAGVGSGNSCTLNNIIANKTVSVVVGCKAGYSPSGNSCLPNLSLSSGTCTSNPLFAYSSCNVGVSGGAGSVNLSTNYGTINSVTKQYIPNCLNNSGSASITATDSEGNISSINLTVTCVYTGCSEIKAKGYALTGGNFWIDMDGLVTSNPINVYCDMANNSYTEIFDLTRQTSLTATDVLNKLNIFTNSPLSSGQVFKDANGAYWKNTSGIEGLSFALNKYPLGSVKIRVNRVAETNSNQGGFSVHSINKTNCSSNWSLGTGCTNDLLMGTAQTSLAVFNYSDGTVGNSNWAFNGLTGTSVYSSAQNLEQELTDVPSTGIYLTTYGRTENGTPAGQSLWNITQLKFKDIYNHQPTSCADAKNKGVLNLSGTTGSGIYLLDNDGFELKNPPVNVNCDMSGLGIATLTASCLDAKRFGQLNSLNTTASGYYTLDLDGVGVGSSTTQSIYCDQVSLGGGWALITNSNTSDTSYPTNTSLTFADNFNLQSLFPASMANKNKMVKVKNGILGEYLYESNNQWSSVITSSTKLRANGNAGPANYLWNIDESYSNSYPLLGPPTNGGSWCDGSTGFSFYMNYIPWNANGIYSGSNAYQGGCNSAAKFSINFNWQVFSK